MKFYNYFLRFHTVKSLHVSFIIDPTGYLFSNVHNQAIIYSLIFYSYYKFVNNTNERIKINYKVHLTYIINILIIVAKIKI